MIADVNLKEKTIYDYNKFVSRLEKGYKFNYSHILNEINFLEVYKDLDNSDILNEYFLNYE